MLKCTIRTSSLSSGRIIAMYGVRNPDKLRHLAQDKPPEPIYAR